MSAQTSALKFLLALAAAAVIASCGGGGDDGSGAANAAFPSTAANLTTANGATYANAVALAARMAATMRLGGTLTNTATPGTFTEPSCPSITPGGGPINVTVTPSTGTVSGTVTYNSFHRCYGLTVSGNSAITGTFNSPQVDVVNFTFSGLTFSAAGQNYQMAGTGTLDWASGASGIAAYAMTLNATVSGASSFRLENFRVDSVLSAGTEELSITGRVFMTDGLVEVIARLPADPPELVVPSTGLQNGGVIMLGATTQAGVFYNGGTNPPNVVIAPR